MFFKPFIDVPVAAIERFGTREASFAVAYMILALAALLGVAVHARHRGFLRRLGRAAAGSREASVRGPGAERLEFAAAAMESAGLGRLWLPYRSAIRERGGLVNLVGPDDWFAVERLPGRGYEAWATTCAGVFLTSGLLFTFIGLAAALLRVGDVGGGSEVDLRAATGAILQASSAKFITSIAGLIAFIGWSLGARAIAAGQARASRDLCDAVQGLTAPLLPETLLFIQAERLEEQASSIGGMAGAIAAALDERIREGLAAVPAAVAQTGREMSEAVRDVGGRIGRVNEAAIAQMVSQLGSDIRASVGLEMRAVATVLQEAAGELDRAKAGIAAAGDGLRREVAEAAGLLGHAAAAVGSALEGGALLLGESGTEMSSALQSGARAAALALSTGLASAGDAVSSKAAEGGRALVEGGRGAGQRMLEVGAEAAAGLEAESRAIREWLGDARGGLAALQSAVAAQTAQLGLAGAAMADAGAEAGKAARSLRTAVKPVAATLDAVARVVSSSEEALGRHAASFGAADASIAETLRLLRESLRPDPAAHAGGDPPDPAPVQPAGAAP